MKLGSMGMVGIAALWSLSSLASAQSTSTPTVTAADYDRAAKMLTDRATPLVDNALSNINWIDDGSFWYQQHDADGDTFQRFDLATGNAAPLFDRARLAKALAKPAGKTLKANSLPITGYTPGSDGSFTVQVNRGSEYRCDAGRCEKVQSKGGKEPGVLSPDKKQQAFIRNWNLWVRDVGTGKETQLTTDGVVDYGYATDNAGWKHTDEAIVKWSPDSNKIATFQQDQRKTGSMTLVGTNVGHPKVETWKYPLVGDKDITMVERVIIDVPSRKTVRLQMPPDQHRSTICDDIACDEEWMDVQWSPDGSALVFASSSRDHKQVWLREADASSGQVRTAFDEKAKTWFDSGIKGISWRYLPQSNEVLWFSQRSNWGHLYLYDLASGKQKKQITQGDWNVSEVVRVDEPSRTVWFVGTGREQGVDPYYQQLYKVGIDSGEVTLLTPENANHTIKLAPDGKHFVDTYSTFDTPPVSVLRDSNDGKVVKELARADVSRLKASGWIPPEKIVVKGRDGKTDLYGFMYKPTQFDPSRKYPIINYIYPGPQVGSVRSRSFVTAQGDNQALAELGFIVVAIDGMGTPGRSKAFHDAYAGNIGDNTLPDQVAAMKELGKRHSFIDMDRIGIWGHSGGGNATGTAMFRYPEFFKVGIAESGNHDNRNYEDDWAEKWHGLEVKDKDGNSNYDDQANQNHAKDLKGKLFLIHGMMDDNVPPSSTLLVVDALMKANKDFDLLLLPNARHGYGDDSYYVMRRRWDYFVKHLLGAQPPAQYALKKVE